VLIYSWLLLTLALQLAVYPEAQVFEHFVKDTKDIVEKSIQLAYYIYARALGKVGFKCSWSQHYDN
jgi:hypothetical protein